MLNTKTDLLKGNILKSLLIFAIPLFISNLFQQLYNTADTMIVGHFLGDTSLAAIGACSAVYELLIGFALGIGNGMSMVVARSFGAGDETLLKRAVAGSLVIGAGVTVIVMIMARIFLYPLLEMLHTPREIIEESYSYIFVVVMCVGVMFAYNLLAGLLRAIGNSVMPLVFLVISSVVNIGLDILFITQFSMGIRGAAVATVIAQGFSALLCLIYILWKAKILIPRKEHFEIEGRLYKELAGQGLSMGVMVAIVSAGTVILQFAINELGYLIIAGHTAARKLNSFCAMPLMTMTLATSTFVSQNRGANQRERIIKAVRYSNWISVLWAAVITIILIFAAPVLVKLLSGSSEKVVIENGAMYLRINAPFYSVLGILSTMRNSLQGIGKKIVPLISSVIELIGKIVFVIFLIPILGYFGVIICEPIIWCLMCAQLVFTFYTDSYIRGGISWQSPTIRK